MRKKYIIKLMAVMLVLAGGCSFNKPGSSSLASIVIDETPLKQVRAETLRVFAKEYYSPTEIKEQEIVFEREGTRKDRLKYASYGQSLVMRVVVEFESFEEDRTLIRADAYAVRGGSSRPQKLLFIDRHSYQALLDQVQERIPVKADSVD